MRTSRPVTRVRLVVGAAAASVLLSVVAVPVAAAVPYHGVRIHPTRTCTAGDRASAGCQAVRADRVDATTGEPLLTTSTSGYTASQLRTAYGITGRGDPSVVIAIVDAYDAPSVAADLVRYRVTMGLPSIETTCTVAGSSPAFAISTSRPAAPCFLKVGQTGVLDPQIPVDSGWAAETDLDVQMASAICPLCSILLVEATSNAFADLATAVTTASRFAGVRAISNSYGTAAGTDLPPSSYPQYADAAAKGIAVTVSTGDSGYGVSFPSSLPQVIAVGGTTLRLDAEGGITSQTAWGGTGSGCAAYASAAPWQQPPTTAACDGRRPIADVSAVADPATGVSVVVNGAWKVFGGTSVAAPIVGAWLALSGGFSADVTASQHVWTDLEWSDVTTGANGDCAVGALCQASPGWDGPTGLGSLPAAPVDQPDLSAPTLETPTATTTGFTTAVTDVVAGVTYTASVSAGTVTTGAASGDRLPVTVTGLAAWQSATVTLRASRAGSVAASTSVAGTALALSPAFGAPVRMIGGFTLNVTNYSPDTTFTARTTAGTLTRGTPTGASLPLVVRGLASGASATVTVVASRPGSPVTGTRSASGSALRWTTSRYTGVTSAARSTIVRLSALVTSSGTPVRGAPTTFSFNGRLYSATTNSYGVASVRISLPSRAGSYAVTARYPGGTVYSRSAASTTLVVR